MSRALLLAAFVLFVVAALVSFIDAWRIEYLHLVGLLAVAFACWVAAALVP